MYGNDGRVNCRFMTRERIGRRVGASCDGASRTQIALLCIRQPITGRLGQSRPTGASESPGIAMA